jgi:Uma2 family endonuclease
LQKVLPLPSAYQPRRVYTYQDYLAWPEGFRAEIFNGEIITMAPPRPIHQETVLALSIQIYDYIRTNHLNSKVYPAPFAVRLFPHQDSRDTLVLEPDITLVCDPSRIDEHGLTGAPDMVIEVLSPSTGHYDREDKKAVYQEAGVKEYWIVDADAKTLTVFLRGVSGDKGNEDYKKICYSKDATVPVTVLPGLSIDLAEVFA